jgi:hypothetical protein
MLRDDLCGRYAVARLGECDSFDRRWLAGSPRRFAYVDGISPPVALDAHLEDRCVMYLLVDSGQL